MQVDLAVQWTVGTVGFGQTSEPILPVGRLLAPVAARVVKWGRVKWVKWGRTFRVCSVATY